jgi:cyclophilin family peptidyl-prolyl cis-trans isomerase
MKIRNLLLAAAAGVLLSSCGGGSDAPAGPTPVVSAASANTARYSETLLLTLTGSNLDQALTLSSSGCRNFARSTASPFVSTASLAYYTCTVSGVGSLLVNVSAAGSTLVNVPFAVEQPQVTMFVSNGLAAIGSIVITLRPQEAPLTVDNFLAYVKSGFYNNTVFHRHGRSITSGPFVLQGGGFTGPLSAAAVFPAPKPPSAAIALEVGRGLSNLRYSLAMARTNELNSATSEFFINTVDNVFLDTSAGGYAVFGTVTTGTTVVDAMVAAPCSLSPINFNVGFSVSTDCLPAPNIVITNASQTR